MKTKRLAVAAIALMFLCRLAGATGILLPKDESLPPLAIKSHRVDVRVKDGVATTSVTQVFLNSTKRQLEGTYVFPIPADAALADFAMYINGKRQSGRIVEADKARQVYEDIVRRMRDPGLLEYMDARLLRMRVFPIEPESTQKVELTYHVRLPFDNGVYRYTFPLRTGEKASKVLDDFTFGVEISQRQPIVNVYSPSHKIGVSRKGENKAVVGFEEEGSYLDKDFVLYYTVGDKDFGLNLITHRVKGQDGFFALMLAPSVDLKDEKVMPKDVCFLIDTSGSMQQEDRIASARDALKFCLKSLRREDRFALVPFSTSVDVYGEGLTEATEENVEAAVAYVSKLEALGGTRLCDAVVEGLKMAPEGKRPYIVVLLSDGKPTLGTVETEDILVEVKGANKGNVRVFTFGIADRVDVPLLDKVAETTRGYSEYVAPGREIETEVSSFFRKVSNPVLSGLKLSFGKVKVKDMYPEELPDLFRGSQVVAFGRYSGQGDVAVQLTGVMQGKEQPFAYDATFPAAVTDNDFLPHLWAQRKIAYLLDEIRLHGESRELKDEVVRLSKEYGIATPYTSYLVLESADAYGRHGIVAKRSVAGTERVATEMARRRNGGAAAREPRVTGAPAAVFDALTMGEKDEEGADFGGGVRNAEKAAERWRGGRRDMDGKGAVALSKALRSYKQASGAGEGLQTKENAVIRKVLHRTFVRIHGVFVDTRYDAEMKTLKVKWGSDLYFALARALPALRKAFALGEDLIVVVKGKAIVISDEGKEKMSDRDVRAFLDVE